MSKHIPMPNSHSRWLVASYDYSDVTPANIPIFGKSTVKILNNPGILGGSCPYQVTLVESKLISDHAREALQPIIVLI